MVNSSNTVGLISPFRFNWSTVIPGSILFEAGTWGLVLELLSKKSRHQESSQGYQGNHNLIFQSK